MGQAAWGETAAQPAQQSGAELPLGRTQRGHGPFRAVHLVDGDEGRLSAHGQPDVTLAQVVVDPMAEGLDGRPLGGRVGFGDARRLAHAGDAHVMGEADLARLDDAGNRGGAAGVGGAGQRDVAFAGQQARGRIESDPAGTGQEHLGPGVKVGEVGLRPAGAVEGLLVGRQLDQVARDETGSKPQVTQNLDQQPGRIAARAGAEGQGFLAGLNTGFQADDVADFPLQPAVEGDQEVDGSERAAVHRGQPRRQSWTAGFGFQIGP